ncbi:hypothetical protein Tco_0240918 [Tanacetum coccineum]
MTTLAEHIIVAGAENHPPMLEKSMYDSWVSRIRLFIKGKKNGRMMLDSIVNGPLVYLTIEENGQTRPKKYSELTKAQQLQDDCDVQATNIILHGLPPDVLAVPTFQQGEDPIDCINKVMAFLSAMESRFPPLNNQLRMSSNPKNQATIQDGRVIVQQVQGRQTQSSLVLETEELLQPQEEIMQLTEDLDAYDSYCDDISSAKVVLIANLLSCDPDVLSEVPYFDSYQNDMINQDVQEMLYSEQTHIDDYPDNDINNDSNIFTYFLYCRSHKMCVIAKEHVVIFVIDDEETLLLEEASVWIEAPSELPQISLVNESLQKLKYQLASFDNVAKKRATSDAITAGQSQEKDTVIRKLKDMIKSLSGKDNVENVKKDIEEIETINIELGIRLGQNYFLDNENYKEKNESIYGEVQEEVIGDNPDYEPLRE